MTESLQVLYLDIFAWLRRDPTAPTTAQDPEAAAPYATRVRRGTTADQPKMGIRISLDIIWTSLSYRAIRYSWKSNDGLGCLLVARRFSLLFTLIKRRGHGHVRVCGGRIRKCDDRASLCRSIYVSLYHIEYTRHHFLCISILESTRNV